MKWIWEVAFELSFVVIILSSDTGKQPRRKTFVILGCEKGDKYRQYKKDAKANTGTRKCVCSFRLKGRPLKTSEGWVLRVMYGSHNHDVTKTLVNHSYVDRLTYDEKTMLTNMTKSMAKPKNILLLLKEHNDKNATTIRQVYSTRTTYRRSLLEASK